MVKRKIFYLQVVGSKAKGRISKRVFQENKARQIFSKPNICYPLDTHTYRVIDIISWKLAANEQLDRTRAVLRNAIDQRSDTNSSNRKSFAHSNNYKFLGIVFAETDLSKFVLRNEKRFQVRILYEFQKPSFQGVR